jgi:hypothetical protein
MGGTGAAHLQQEPVDPVRLLLVPGASRKAHGRPDARDRTGESGHASIQTTGDVYTDWDVEQLAESLLEAIEND